MDQDLNRRRKTFISVALAHVVSDCYGGFWPVFKYLARLDIGVAGTIFSITSVTGCLLHPLFGHLGEGRRARAFILWGTGLSLVLVLVGPLMIGSHRLGPTGFIVALCAVLFVTRIGQAIFHPVAAAMAGAQSRTRRSVLLGVFASMGWVGLALSQPMFSSVYLSTHGHTELLLFPGLILLALVAAWCRPSTTSRVTAPSASPVPGGAARGRWRLFAVFTVVAMMYAFGMGLIFLLPELLEVKACSAWMVRGGGMSVLSIGTMATMVPVSYLADRAGRERLLLISVAVALSVYVLVLSWGQPSPLMMGFFLFVLGGAAGVSNPLGVSYGQELMPHRASTVSGFMMGWAWVVGEITPAVMGWLAKSPDLGVTGALSWLTVANVIALASAALLFRRRRRF